MQKTDPPFNGEAGRRMMNTLFLSNWQHERIGSEFLSDQERGAMVKDRHAADQARTKRDELHDKRMEGVRSTPAPPTYKRRRTRGGHLQSLAARMPKEMEL
jgi:DNA excision repair protein ERCC-4